MKLPTWRPNEFDEMPTGPGGTALIFGLVDLIRYLANDLLVPLLRFVVILPIAYARSLRSDEWTIEAVTYFPVEERYVWMTDRAHLENVADAVAAGLGRGTVPRPQGATFLGAR